MTLRSEMLSSTWGVGVGVACTISTLVAGYIIHLFTCRGRGKRKSCPPNTVLLHQFKRGPWAPSISPFPIKLETYLRMANIPYQTDFDTPMSPKGKCPWITYNDVDVADSQFCIEFLNKEFSVDMNASLSAEDRAVALAFRKLIEDDLFWWGLLERWVFGDKHDLAKWMRLSYILVRCLSFKFRLVAWGQGMGKHSPDEVKAIGMADLKALSVFLGKKKFFMGDEPSEIDCALFGSLAQLKWHGPHPACYVKLLKDDLPNLFEYCDRMKERFWPDWDECITHGGTRRPLK